MSMFRSLLMQKRSVGGYILEQAKVILDAINNTGNGHGTPTDYWTDLSGNGNNFIIININWSEKGAEITKYSSVCNSTMLSQGQNRTIEICCSIDEGYIGSEEQPLIADFDEKNGTHAGNFGLQNASFTSGIGLTYCDMYANFHDYCILNGNDFVRNQRYTISASINENGTLKGYIDGVKVLEETNQELLPLTADAQYKAFGRYLGECNLNGVIHSIRIYDKELTQDEITHNYITDVNKFDESGRLPSAYQEVEYIRATGTQYIDTGVYGTENIDFDLEISWDTIASDGQYYIGGFDNYCPAVVANGTRLDRISIVQYGYSKYTLRNVSSSTKHKVSVIGGNIYFDDVLKTTQARTTGTDIYGFRIFNQPAQSVYGADGYLYSLKMYDSGTLIRDFVPCYRKNDNEIGLYDLANDVFYTNDGTGTFIKGNDV